MDLFDLDEVDLENKKLLRISELERLIQKYQTSLKALKLL